MIPGFPFSNTIRSDRTLASDDQFFQDRWICMIRTIEFHTGVYSSCIIGFIAVSILLIIIRRKILRDQHREVIHDQTCKDFLYHAFLFL